MKAAEEGVMEYANTITPNVVALPARASNSRNVSERARTYSKLLPVTQAGTLREEL